MTTHPTDTQDGGTARTDAEIIRIDSTNGESRFEALPKFARTLEKELNEAKKALDFNTRTLADFGKEVANLRATLKLKDVLITEAIQEARTLDANTDPLVDTILTPALALTPKSPTP